MKRNFEWMQDWLNAYFEDNETASTADEIMGWIYQQPMTAED